MIAKTKTVVPKLLLLKSNDINPRLPQHFYVTRMLPPACEFEIDTPKV